jgi:hypothetical protein
MTDFEELITRGVRGFDPAEVAYLAGLRARASEERLQARLALLEASFDETRASVARHLDDPHYDDATRQEMRAAFDAGDFISVEILASTRPRKRPSPLRDEWIAKMRARAEERGVVSDGGADAVLAAAAVEARAAAIAAEARALDLESVGPYNPYALALRILGRLDDLAPTYLASWVAYLEDVAALEPEPVVEKKRRR